MLLSKLSKELISIKYDRYSALSSLRLLKRIESLRQNLFLELLRFVIHVKLVIAVLALLTMNRH